MSELEFISGVMGSGKSERLIEEIEKNEDSNYLIIKPSTDTRDGAKVVTRAHNRTHDAVVIDEENEQMTSLMVKGMRAYDTVYIDEVQFFSEKFINKLINYCDMYEVKVVASGLTYDFKGDFFPSSKVLYKQVLFDKYEYHTTACAFCPSKEANIDILVDGKYNIIKDGDSVKIDDGTNEFKTVCSPCYRRLIK